MSEHDNHLTQQPSPPLLQQSPASIRWHAWGEAAFALARHAGKPVFLAVGSVSCADSQRMQHEVFADPDIALRLQEVFVCIRLNREARPDIARVYQRLCRILTGSGDGPLHLALTPEREAFFVANYLGKHSASGHTGLLAVIEEIAQLWATDPAALQESARKITALLHAQSIETQAQRPTLPLQERALAALRLEFDDEQGGFRTVPKFPMPLNVLFLLRYGQRTGQLDATAMAHQTLRALRHGGIWDQLAGGFYRSSHDPYWRQADTEKRLTDQALLLLAYTAGWEHQADPLYRQTAQELVDFLQTELRHPDGGWMTALAADNSQGGYYLWTEAELRSHLADADWQLVQQVWNIQVSGNFQEARTGRLTGENQLYLTRPLQLWAECLGIPFAELAAQYRRIQVQLLKLRQKRERPLCEPIRRCDANALAIAALARAGRILAEPAWITLAQDNWRWLHGMYATPTGGLRHCADSPPGEISGFLDDYAFCIWALLELAESLGEAANTPLLHTARHLCSDVNLRFGDAKGEPGYFLSDRNAETPLVRLKEDYDSDVPAGNAVMLHNLGRLYALTGDRSCLETANTLTGLLGQRAAQFPQAYLHLIDGLGELPQAEA